MSLLDKKCVPCEGGTSPLTAEEVVPLKAEISAEWDVVDNKMLSRSFKFKNFKEAIVFVSKVAEIAESDGHHPDIHIHYNKVLLELWTHAVDGLSENDFIVARKIETI